MSLKIEGIFHQDTNTVSYLVSEPTSKQAAIIDPVLDFDPAASRISKHSVESLGDRIENAGLDLVYILETHLHADHLSGAQYLKGRFGARLGIGAEIARVQKTFAAIFNTGEDFDADGSQFDLLLADGDRLPLGADSIGVIYTPGHTPACVTYLAGGAAIVGDTIFMPDMGTARCDFPGGDAATLYRSIQRILSLPPETRILVCHDYGPDGRDYAWESTVEDQLRENIHVKQGTGEDAFVKMRQARDATMELPRLLLPSVQVNMRAGALPPAEENGISYLKLPINRF